MRQTYRAAGCVSEEVGAAASNGMQRRADVQVLKDGWNFKFQDEAGHHPGCAKTVRFDSSLCHLHCPPWRGSDGTCYHASPDDVWM